MVLANGPAECSESNDRKDSTSYLLRPGFGVLANDVLFEAFLTYAKDLRADGVLAFNHQGLGGNHPPESQLKRMKSVIARRLAILRENGLSPQINYFSTLGHRSATPAPEVDYFTEQVDIGGSIIRGCVCPLDADFLQYISRSYALFADDVDAIWIDDDFRLSWRPPHYRNQCFCALHRERYAARTRTELPFEEIAELLARDPVRCSSTEIAMRTQWKSLQAASLVQLLERITDACRTANPNVRMGLMLNRCEAMLGHGRDLNAEIRAMSHPQAKVPWVRFGGACYTDESPLRILDAVQGFDRTAAMLSAPVRISSEIEHFPWPVGAKSARVLALEMATLAATVGGDMTLSIHDGRFGLDDVSGNIRARLPGLKDRLDALAALARGRIRRGVSSPVPASMGSSGRIDANGPNYVMNHSLARVGVPTAPASPSPVILTLEHAVIASDEQIRRWAADGLIITTEAFHHLRSIRSLFTDVGVEVSKIGDTRAVPPGIAEVITTERAAAHIRGKRLVSGHYIGFHANFQVAVDDDPQAHVWSRYYDNLGEEWTPSVVTWLSETCRLAVVSHNGTNLRETGRSWLYQNLIAALAPTKAPAMVETVTGIYPIDWRSETDAVVVLANYSHEDYSEITLWIPGCGTPGKVDRLDQNNEFIPVDHEIKPHAAGGIRITLYSPTEHLTAHAYRFDGMGSLASEKGREFHGE